MVVSYLPLALVIAYFVWLNIQFMRSAIIGGVFLAVRLRSSSIGGVSLAAGSLVVLTYVIGPVITFGLLILVSGSFLGGACFIGLIAILYFLIPVVGKEMMLAGIEEHLARSRLSEDT